MPALLIAATNATYAANAGAAAYAAAAAAANAAYTANAGANAAAGAEDGVMADFAERVVQLLVRLKAPGCQWLDLAPLDGPTSQTDPKSLNRYLKKRNEALESLARQTDTPKEKL